MNLIKNYRAIAREKINKWQIELSHEEFYRNVATLMFGAIFAQLLPLLVSPILSRLYTPENFGILAYFMALGAIGSSIVTGKYELSIILPKEKKDSFDLLKLTFAVTCVMSLAILIVVSLIGILSCGIIGNMSFHHWFYVLPVFVMIVGITQGLNYWLNWNKDYKALAISKVTKNFTNSFFSVLLGIYNVGVTGLLTSLVVGQLAACLILLKKSRKLVGNLSIKIGFIHLRKLAYDYKGFPTLNMPSSLVNTVSVQMPLLLLISFYGATTGGLFAFAHRILQAPMALIGASIGQVYVQKASENKEDVKFVQLLTIRLFKQLVQIGLLPIIVIVLFGQDLFTFFFGEDWALSGRYAQVLSPWIFIVFISSPFSVLLIVYEKHKINLGYNLSLFLSRVLVILIGALYLSDAYWVVAAFSFVGSIIWMRMLIYLFQLVEVNWRILIGLFVKSSWHLITLSVVLKFVISLI